MKKLKIPRLKNYYKKEIVFNLVKELGLKNIMQAPRLKKIVLNMGLGERIKKPSKTYLFWCELINYVEIDF